MSNVYTQCAFFNTIYLTQKMAEMKSEVRKFVNTFRKLFTMNKQLHIYRQLNGIKIVYKIVKKKRITRSNKHKKMNKYIKYVYENNKFYTRDVVYKKLTFNKLCTSV